MFRSIYVLRHGPAGEIGDFAKTGRPDSERPLTEEGRDEVEKVGRALRELIPQLDLILTSPYTRAKQTAKIVAKAFKKVEVEESADLRPMIPVEKICSALEALDPALSVMVVGHQPHLSQLLSFLLTGDGRGIFDIKKTGFAALEVEMRSGFKPKAQLKCFLQPSQIKKIRKS